MDLTWLSLSNTGDIISGFFSSQRDRRAREKGCTRTQRFNSNSQYWKRPPIVLGWLSRFSQCFFTWIADEHVSGIQMKEVMPE